MSHYIPVFTCVVACEAVASGETSPEEALRLIAPDPWISTSRNWWHQNLVSAVLDTYPGLEKLRYLCKEVAIVPNNQLIGTSAAISELLEAILRNAEAFLPLQVLVSSAEEIRLQLGQAEVSRHFDDDGSRALGNFFTFLVSQAAAIDEARQRGGCLLYVQPRP
jgi:hypothetical protein